MRSDAIAFIEAAYDLAAPHEEWLTTLLGHTIALVPTATRASGFRHAGLEHPEPASMVGVGFDETFFAASRGATQRFPADLRARMFAPGQVSTLSELEHEPLPPEAQRFMHEAGALDFFGCVALDAAGEGVVLSTDLARRMTLPKTVRRRWERLGVHLAAASRLRLRQHEAPAMSAAVLDAEGRLHHAEGDAKEVPARVDLREAVVARERARGALRHREPDEALALWRGLVSGRWTLVDRFEQDGRRFVVAHKNHAAVIAPLTLDVREQQVLVYVALGTPLKNIAYALGLSLPAVSRAKRAAFEKLGIRSAADAALLVSALSPGARAP